MIYTIYDEGNHAACYPVSEWLDLLSSSIEISEKEPEFSLHFVTDDEIRELNRTYRDKDEPTDVLTFAFNDGDEFPEIDEETEDLGDIFISLESMRRNAESFFDSSALLMHVKTGHISECGRYAAAYG